jgi:hypothetical protein
MVVLIGAAQTRADLSLLDGFSSAPKFRMSIRLLALDLYAIFSLSSSSYRYHFMVEFVKSLP